MIAGQNLNFLLRRLTLHTSGVRDFDELAIPYRAVAADLDDGSMVVLDQGDLADAMRASMAIPGAFTPQEIDGRLLIDGGTIRNLPYDIVKDMGADVVIVVDVGTVYGRLAPEPGFLAVAMRALDQATMANASESRSQLTAEDLLLVPDLEGISIASFPSMADAAERGESQARAQLDALRRFSVSEAEYAAWRAQQRAGRQVPAIEVADVFVRAGDRIDPRRVRRCITTPSGVPLDIETLHDDLIRTYRLGEFELVDYHLQPRPDSPAYDLVVDTRDKSWGPHYLRFGLALTDHFDGEAAYQLTFYHRLAAINARGAEWRNLLSLGDQIYASTEFYQPLTFSGRWFVAPRLQYDQDKRKIFAGPEVAFMQDVRRWRAACDLGWNPSHASELRAGVYTGFAELEVEEFGGLLRESGHEGGLEGKFGFDNLDRAAFPRSGLEVRAAAVLSRPGLGADWQYDRIELALRGAVSSGRTTFAGRAEAGSSFGSELPSFDAFELGGFARLSGLEPGALRGDDFAMFVAGVRHEITRLAPPLGGAVVIGLQGELGATWWQSDEPAIGDLMPGGAAYLGAETFLGPVYFGYGLTEGGYDELFLYVGQVY